MKILLIKWGIIPEKNSSEGEQRIIFLSDGRKVKAPAKPEKVCLARSVYPMRENLTLSSWVEAIKLRKTFSDNKIQLVKHYLNA